MFKKKEQVAEPERAKPAAEYESIVVALTDILYVLDMDGNLFKWNKVAEEVSGYSPEELLNKPALEFFPEEDRAAIMDGINRTFKEGKATAEGRFLTKDGRLIPYAWTGAVLKDAEGEIIGMTGIGRDITELKRLQEKEKAAAAENARAEEAEKYSKELEKKVKELEKLHDLTVGRELKMKKMEEEMEELKKRLKEKEK